MLNRPSFAILVLLLAGLLTSSLSAGTIADKLNERISSSPVDQDSLIRVVIIPRSDFAPAVFKQNLNSLQTRAERHRYGVARLKAAAENTQTVALERLRQLEQSGKAKNVKSFWITNLIEAELTPEAITRLASNPTIEKIDLYPTIVSIPVQVNASPLRSVIGVEENLRTVRADSAWQLGFDGRGRLVCNFDTGVDGVHPALVNNYRGNKGYDAAECWFSPTDTSTFPQHFPTALASAFHGTHTMGIMVGHDDATGDTVGVAPGADWIAAVAIDVPGASIFEAFQWAADPDGNPNTVTDLPDVINHSWGLPQIECFDIFWDVIDNVEALGTVNIFSAGNSGGGLETILSPASRAETSISNFAVGNIDHRDSIIADKSSRGPSPCDGVSFKPNVVAPGEYINSTVPNGGYNMVSGTSMAAPHVAGAVAILRQKNPNATVDQIKTALLNSTVDLGEAGPDNDYGWGLIDIIEALKQIDLLTIPSLQVERLTYPEINPGDAVQLELVIKNVGAATTDNVFALFSNPESGLTINTSRIDFAKIASDGLGIGQSLLDLEFSPTAEAGRFYSLDMNIFDNSGFLKFQRLSFFVGSQGERTYFHHDSGRVKFTISNYGAFGFHGTSGTSASNGSYIPLDFLGFSFDRDANDLFESALLIGVDTAHVSDCARNFALEPDNDFAVLPGGSIVSSVPGAKADQQTVSRFDDSYAEHPIGLTVEQRSYGWGTAPDDKFVILEYIITNTTASSIGGIWAGLFFDWDIVAFSSNHGAAVPDDEIGYLCYYLLGDTLDFRGVRILNDEGMVNHHIFLWDDIADGNMTETVKYGALSSNFVHGYKSALRDYSHITTTGPFNLDAGESDTAAFAVIAGQNWTEFVEAADLAVQKYDLILDADDSPAPLPTLFTLEQNYPNPFNPSTTIAFDLPRAGEARLEIFDILGRRVKVLLDEKLPAGRQEVIWDGTDSRGRTVAGGVYLYRVKFDRADLTRKMILLK